jgi:hypothetical protein
MMRFAALVLLVAACGDPCPEPEYGGSATDESWKAMADAEGRAIVDDVNAPIVQAPAEGHVYAASAARPTIRWTAAFASAPAPAGPRRLAAARSPWRALLGWVIPDAHAHGHPVTGPAFYLRVELPGRACPVRVVTTDREWLVSEDAWAAFTAATGPLTLRVDGAYLTGDRVTEGPYRATSARKFSVQP